MQKPTIVFLLCLFAVIFFVSSCDCGSSFKHKPKPFSCSTKPTREEIIAALPIASCAECKLAVDGVRLVLKTNKSEHSMADVAILFCELLHIEDKTVCVDVIHEFQDFFFYAVTNDKLVSPALLCGILGMCDPPVYPTWNVTFPTPQPPVKPYPVPKSGDPRIYILHITDLHVDPLYTPGLETQCGEPICCRPPNPLGSPGNMAGYWGDYHCDLPLWTYENMLKWIAKNLPEINYAIFTGDMPPHDIWAETRNSTLDISGLEISMFQKFLPNITLFPAVGNHEAVPVNEFPTRDIKGEFDMSWLYTPLSRMWSKWLPPAAVKQVQYAGYYTALTPDGARIISLNTNLGCNTENWWLTLPSNESADPDEQLHWLVQTLHSAELANEMVYLIMHISPGLDCAHQWWENYHKIIERYQNNIMGSFAGHTHADLVQTTYALQSNGTQFRPMMTTYFPGSVTPFEPENPGFRVYEVDKKTKAIVDYREFAMDLRKANAVGNVTWYLEYSAKRDYKMVDLSPSGWRDMAIRSMQGNQALLYEYAAHRNKGVGGCASGDQSCLHSAWCDMWVGPPGYQFVICGQ